MCRRFPKFQEIILLTKSETKNQSYRFATNERNPFNLYKRPIKKKTKKKRIFGVDHS